MKNYNLNLINQYFLEKLKTEKEFVYDALKMSSHIPLSKGDGLCSQNAFRKKIDYAQLKLANGSHNKKSEIYISDDTLLVLEICSILGITYSDLLQEATPQNISLLRKEPEYIAAERHSELLNVMEKILNTMEETKKQTGYATRKKRETIEDKMNFLNHWSIMFSSFEAPHWYKTDFFWHTLELFARDIKAHLTTGRLDKARLKELIPETNEEGRAFLILYINYGLLVIITDCIKRFYNIAFASKNKANRKVIGASKKIEDLQTTREEIDKNVTKEEKDKIEEEIALAENDAYTKKIALLVKNEELKEVQYTSVLSMFTELTKDYYLLISDFLKQFQRKKQEVKLVFGEDGSEAFQFGKLNFISLNVDVFKALLRCMQNIILVCAANVEEKKRKHCIEDIVQGKHLYFAYFYVKDDNFKLLKQEKRNIRDIFKQMEDSGFVVSRHHNKAKNDLSDAQRKALDKSNRLDKEVK